MASGHARALVTSLISATTQPSSTACNRSPGFPHESMILSIASRSGATSRQFEQAIRAERPSRAPARRHHQDCRDRSRSISASPADQIVAVASGLESDLGNRCRVIDQLDAYQIEFSFQSVPQSTPVVRRTLIQMRSGLSIHRIEELGDLHDHLPSLPDDKLFALQSRQMLSHSRPRGSDQVGDVLVAERYS
jgi:hypothetical protein